MKSEGLSVTQISKNIGKPKSTVSRILKKSQQLAMLGRPRKTNESTDRKMILAIKRNRFSSYSVISSSFYVSRETLRWRANEFGFKSRVAVINPLTKYNNLKRKLWCKNHLNENFSNCIFSDVCSFQLKDCCCAKHQLVHRTSSEKFTQCCQESQETESLMVWGCITENGQDHLSSSMELSK